MCVMVSGLGVRLFQRPPPASFEFHLSVRSNEHNVFACGDKFKSRVAKSGNTVPEFGSSVFLDGYEIFT